MQIRHRRHYAPMHAFLSSSSWSNNNNNNITTASKRIWLILIVMALSSILISVLHPSSRQQHRSSSRYSEDQQYEFRLLMPNLRAPVRDDAFYPRVSYLNPGAFEGEISVAKGPPRRPVSPSSTTHGYLLRGDSNTTKSTTSGRTRLYDQTRYYVHGSSKDFRGLEKRDWPRHPFIDTCVPLAKWHAKQFPTCNSVHETALGLGLYEQRLSLLNGNGFWRNAWKYDETGRNSTNSSSYVGGVPPSNSTESLLSSPTTVWKTFK